MLAVAVAELGVLIYLRLYLPLEALEVAAMAGVMFTMADQMG
jgi:hypothetical protein